MSLVERLREARTVINGLELGPIDLCVKAADEIERQVRYIESLEHYEAVHKERIAELEGHYNRVKSQTCMCRFDKANGEGEPGTVPSSECEYHKALRADNKRLRAALLSEWTVATEPPEDDGHYIVGLASGGSWLGHFCRSRWWKNENGKITEFGETEFGDDLTVTHWMPLPKPPTLREDEDE